MAVIALTSASGSPGVTTTALGLAMSWPRPVVLVEADPTGGSGLLSGFFRGTREYDAGLIELAWSAVDLSDALAAVVRPIEDTQVCFVAGTRSPQQAGGLRELWEPLAEALADLESTGQDVLVDVGRLGLVGSPEPLLAHADLTLLLTRTTLPALSAARSWAESMRRDATGLGRRAVLLVGEGQPYRAAEVVKVLGLPVLGGIADDREAAAVYHRGAIPPKRFETSGFTKSLRAAVEAITAQVSRTRAELLEGVTS
jgi:MinD-like ATPase involved in chromosome partitioning or flagellar assembly